MLRPAFVLVLCARAASANPAADVPAGIDDAGGRIDAIGTLDYEFEQDSSQIWREHVGDPTASGNSPLPTERDLAFRQSRHTITPRLDIGLYHDTWISVALPVIVNQSRQLSLDSGVDRTTSSTVTDGFLPSAGFDAQNNGGATAGDVMFRGVDRRGLDQIHLGIGVAPMNQARDPSKPTWKIGAELRLAIGDVMKFDPTMPSANTAVGYGVHELRLWTSFDRKVGLFEPHMDLWWQAPIGTTKDSLFQDPGFGATNSGKGMQAGTHFGVEINAYDDPVNHDHIGIDLGGVITGHFEGRDYSEMWEVFANNPQLALDADPVTPGMQTLPYPGISNIEQYLETRLTAAVRASIGPKVHFAATFALMWETDHSITFADAGVVLPTCGATMTTGCVQMGDGNIIQPGTAEVNPLHNDKIDLVGHRYLSQDNFGYILGVQGEVLF
ncbi:MAG TPA: hypothetical protein VGG74_08455 [Kofleriaceae bacterium]